VFLLPLSLVMLLIGAPAGRLERRFGSKPPVLGGIAFAFAGFVMLLVGHDDSAPV
jgi:lipopolysaccharide export LptBFGC system permease protein LptF